MNDQAIIRAILDGYQLSPWGDHGVVHWARVLENGLRLAEITGADVTVVRLFALFHDARRESEFNDPGHGRRGAELAAALRGKLFDLDDAAFALLREACTYHTDGLTEGDVTVQTCWDADRLDLGRVGVVPQRRFLCTAAAKDARNLNWAHERAVMRFEPPLVGEGWGLRRGW
jgi:uncharacterized protein